jgi:hypothetical protein
MIQGKNYMSISVGEENAFNKMQHKLMIKNP